MKYKYHISCEGNIDEDALEDLLQNNGLNEVFIEKNIDVEAFISEQSSEPVSDMENIWKIVLKNAMVTKYKLSDVLCRKRLCTKITSMRDLAQAVYDCCIEQDKSYALCGHLLYQLFGSIQED